MVHRSADRFVPSSEDISLWAEKHWSLCALCSTMWTPMPSTCSSGTPMRCFCCSLSCLSTSGSPACNFGSSAGKTHSDLMLNCMEVSWWCCHVRRRGAFSVIATNHALLLCVNIFVGQSMEMSSVRLPMR